jgi:putative addiction module component (TIGR02574 family)
MTKVAKALSARARKLSPSERLELVDDILASLDEPSTDRLWAKEAEERLAAYRRGEVEAVPPRHVRAKYRVKRERPGPARRPRGRSAHAATRDLCGIAETADPGLSARRMSDLLRARHGRPRSR